MTVFGGDEIFAADLNAYAATSTAVTSDSANFTTSETTVITHTASLISGRKYEILASGTFASSVAADLVIARIRLTSLAGTQLAGGQLSIATTSGVGYTITMRAEYTAGATGNQDFVFTGIRNGGTGNIRLEAGPTQPAYLAVRLMD